MFGRFSFACEFGWGKRGYEYQLNNSLPTVERQRFREFC